MTNPLTPTSSDVFHHFNSTPLDMLLAEHQSVNPENKVLALFHRCLAEVPAYRRFLEARGLNPAEIISIKAFQQLPLMGKANYMQAYPLPERCLGGSLKGSDRVAVSSGSTGQPTFWPRSVLHELDVAVRFEQVFYDSFRVHERALWRWFASRWVIGWAVCTRHPAVGIWHVRVIR
jgi:phenylacetate-CoA ligase